MLSTCAKGLQRLEDDEIVEKARAEGRVILTHDLDFGLWAEKPGRNRYRLRATAGKSQAFTVFTVLQNLAKARKVTVTFDIEAEAEEPFDPVWLRNAVEEPLDEADIQVSSQLEG